jgi:hypothetical protein
MEFSPGPDYLKTSGGTGTFTSMGMTIKLRRFDWTTRFFLRPKGPLHHFNYDSAYQPSLVPSQARQGLLD